MSVLDEQSRAQLETMNRLRDSVHALAPDLKLELEARVVPQEMAEYPPVFLCEVTDGKRTYRVGGGHLTIWLRNSALEGTNFIDLAMRAVFGRFIAGLGQTKWRTTLRDAGFESGQLPEDF